jgi:hypothetical protein
MERSVIIKCIVYFVTSYVANIFYGSKRLVNLETRALARFSLYVDCPLILTGLKYFELTGKF